MSRSALAVVLAAAQLLVAQNPPPGFNPPIGGSQAQQAPPVQPPAAAAQGTQGDAQGVHARLDGAAAPPLGHESRRAATACAAPAISLRRTSLLLRFSTASPLWPDAY